MAKREKAIINLEAVKQFLSDNPDLYERGSAQFKRTEMAKAIRNKTMESDAFVYLYNHCDNWYIREFCLDYCGYSFQEAARNGLLRAVSAQCEWGELYNEMKGFFTSAQEFLDFVKELYDIDLSEDKVTIDYSKNNLDFLTFAKAILNTGARDYFLSKRKQEDPQVYAKFYNDAYEYIIKLNQYYESLNHGSEVNRETALYDIYDRLWVFNYPVLKKHIDECFNDNLKTVFLMKVAKKACYTNRRKIDYFENREDLFRVLSDIKALNPNNFPYIDNRNDVSYMSRENGKRFAYDLYNFMTESAGGEGLSREDKDSLYKIVVLDNIKKDRPCSDFSRDFVKAALNVAPKEELDYVFERCAMLYNTRDVLSNVESLGNYNLNFYPTPKMTELMIESGYGWNEIQIPQEHLYDMEYIEDLTRRIGRINGIIFGNNYNGNPFFTSKIDIDKMPEEFFKKYEMFIDWSCVSYTDGLSAEFMKKYRDYISFSRVRPVAARRVDEELAEWLLAQDDYPCHNVVRQSKNLGIAFIAKHLPLIWSYCGGRKVEVNKDDVTLADLISNLS